MRPWGRKFIPVAAAPHSAQSTGMGSEIRVAHFDADGGSVTIIAGSAEEKRAIISGRSKRQC